MDLKKSIVTILSQAKAEIQANMAANHENASGRTSRGFRVEEYDGGVRLVLAHEEYANIPCKPRGEGSVRVGVAPLQTLEIGYKGGKVPKGFYYIIKQWTRDKGMQFGRESERQTFAYFTARKIAKSGTKRNRQHVRIYGIPVAKAQFQIENDIRAVLTAQINRVAKSNFY